MKWVIIILIILAVLLLAGLIWTSMKRKKDQVARERASELRSDAAQTAGQHHEEEAKARASQAEAERARAEADRLDARAQEQQTSLAQTRAQHEDRLREADRVDPDVDHRASDYQPGTSHATGGNDDRLGHDDQGSHRDQGGSTRAFSSPGQDGGRGPEEQRTDRGSGHAEHGYSDQGHTDQVPPPSGPETSVPEDAYERGYQDGQDPERTHEPPRSQRDDV